MYNVKKKFKLKSRPPLPSAQDEDFDQVVAALPHDQASHLKLIRILGARDTAIGRISLEYHSTIVTYFILYGIRKEDATDPGEYDVRQYLPYLEIINLNLAAYKYFQRVLKGDEQTAPVSCNDPAHDQKQVPILHDTFYKYVDTVKSEQLKALSPAKEVVEDLPPTVAVTSEKIISEDEIDAMLLRHCHLEDGPSKEVQSSECEEMHTHLVSGDSQIENSLPSPDVDLEKDQTFKIAKTEFSIKIESSPVPQAESSPLGSMDSSLAFTNNERILRKRLDEWPSLRPPNRANFSEKRSRDEWPSLRPPGMEVTARSRRERSRFKPP